MPFRRNPPVHAREPSPPQPSTIWLESLRGASVHNHSNQKAWLPLGCYLLNFERVGPKRASAFTVCSCVWARASRVVQRERSWSTRPSRRSTNTLVTALKTCLADARRLCSSTLLVLIHVEIAVPRSLHISRRVVALLCTQCNLPVNTGTSLIHCFAQQVNYMRLL